MTATRVLIIGSSPQAFALRGQLLEKGFACAVAYGNGEVFRHISEQSPDILLLEFDGRTKAGQELATSIKREKSLPVIALVHRDTLENGGIVTDIDDFIVEPYPDIELILRIERLLKNSPVQVKVNPDETVTVGDLVIDIARCEVSVAGRIVILAFKEYELLKFLVGNRGRVFTRQALLDKVWGYDYFGGDRTVDVHIRRLRSKIEDSKHSFIDTVRSIGYRFKEDT